MDFNLRKRNKRPARYAIWGSILFLLGTLALVALELLNTYHQEEENALRQANGLSQLLAERLAAGISEAGLILQSSSQLPQVQALLHTGKSSEDGQQKLFQQLQQQLQLAPYLSRIEIIDSACQAIFTSRQAAIVRQPHNEFCRWLHRNEDPENNYTAAQHNPEQHGIVLASKLRDDGGNVIGMAAGVIANNFFQDEVSRITVGEHGEILVLDQRQLMVARWPKPPKGLERQFRPLQPAKLLSRDGNQAQFSAPSNIDGVTRLYSQSQTGRYPFQVAVGIARKDFTRSVQEKAMLALLGWLFIAGMTLLALRNYLSNLRQHTLLSRSTDLIRQSEEEAKLILDTAPLALLLVNPKTRRIQRANALARAMLQLPPRAAGSKEDSDILNLPFRLQPLDQWLEAGQEIENQEMELELEDHSRLWVIVSLRPLGERTPPSTLVALYDISSRKQLEQQLQESNQQLSEMAATDPLTHLYNRRYADMMLKDEISRCERYGQTMTIAVFDIDHFKQFNDRHGHQAGDNVLVAVANALTDTTRNTDISARVGGEEFLVIFPCTRLRDAQKVMERVQVVLSQTRFPLVDQSVTFSGGLTDWRPHDTPELMLARADRLLYEAKVAGRNILFNDLDMI
ncbi:diguanylate cyclase (GGDEF)-like protein [Chromobacterium alkanivorans]|uniref:sensor domain-containing diguanylate cyclase n=1 Tax=Chromobacterium alkanivorans TaxID=1071719 RepID=UPI0021695DC0|nr:diguanylate cyclase [Chromobacterium alkanivorans]MCS3804140.1 diguanylate cyclase (GGDEF)-like protein [Chromobacterium alkanivorans]MCS3818639.1 diguanylate cyclase (GGDEF)-like protein [Chromobacterium alkanivorans]MCS3873426.1 diguanylate cyclase (GGDEF)-like protein [Chromobacterium alkanivorans]